jgi:hypothetical protein
MPSQMKIKKFCVSATIVGAQVLFWAGCSNNHPDPDKIVNEAVVAVRCDNIVSNGWLLYHIKEIWKDESEGRFGLGQGRFFRNECGNIILQDIVKVLHIQELFIRNCLCQVNQIISHQQTATKITEHLVAWRHAIC